MVMFQIPHKNTIDLSSVCVPAYLNVPLPLATFQINPNIEYTITDLRKNSIYLLERFSFSCDIEENDFKVALDQSKLPSLKIYYGNSKDIATKRDLVLITYYQNTDITNFLQTSAQDDTLKMKLSGSLLQTSELIGFNSVNFLLSFVIYQIDNNDYNKNHREELEKNYGSKIRK